MPFLSPTAPEGLPQRDADVLDRVMGVDMQVALGADREVDHAVARDLVEHVVEKRHAGGELGAAGAVQIHLDDDLRFVRVALEVGRAVRKCSGCVHW